jgi:hypothetical protein
MLVTDALELIIFFVLQTSSEVEFEWPRILEVAHIIISLLCRLLSIALLIWVFWVRKDTTVIAIFGLMLYTAPYVMPLMRANPLQGQVGGGWALEIETFCRRVKWHHAVGRVPFGAQNSHT